VGQTIEGGTTFVNMLNLKHYRAQKDTMKKYGLLIIALLGTWILTSCSTNPFQSCSYPCANRDLLTETWLQQVNANPERWICNASHWFLTGEPNELECYARGPFVKAMTVSEVHVPDFTNLKVSGNFRIQLIGQQRHNSVVIVGPNDQVVRAAVEMRDCTLSIHPTRECPGPVDQVIIRIGLRNLNNITYAGTGLIEGRDITSNALSITSFGSGNILLMGAMNLTNVTQWGSGTITVMGVCAPCLNVLVNGCGSVNLSGRLGLRSITHCGNGIINLIGADTSGLTIYATGNGLTTVVGYANVRRIVARDCSRVYLYWVNANIVDLTATEGARIGLAGITNCLNANLSGSSRFEGRYLHADNVFVHTFNTSHANVAPDTKIFAASSQSSTIYFLGSPKMVSKYTQQPGLVLGLDNEIQVMPCVGLAPPNVVRCPEVSCGVQVTPYKLSYFR